MSMPEAGDSRSGADAVWTSGAEPFAKFGPTLCWPTSCAGLAKRAGIDPGKIEDVVTGRRHAGRRAGGQRRPARRACWPVSPSRCRPSRSTACADRASKQFISPRRRVAAGDHEYAIGAGVESMTRVPMFCDIGGGFEKLNPAVLEKLRPDSPGRKRRADRRAWHITRDDVDQFSAESHRRASAAAAPAPTTKSCRRRASTRTASRSSSNATKAFARRSTRPRCGRSPRCFARAVTAS